MGKQLTTYIQLNWVLALGLIVGCFACQSEREQVQSQNLPTQDSVATTPTTTNRQKKTIIFFGNSLTAGFGVDPSQAFPALIQQKIDSLQLNYDVVNAGLSGETTASGNSRLDWILKKQNIDVLVLELGANDGLRGIAPQETRKNLQEMITKIQKAYPKAKIILAGMKVPPNMSQEYAQAFEQIFPQLATQNNLALIPFLLDKVGGEPHLNLPDGIHPNIQGHHIVAHNVWKVLKDILLKDP